MKRFIALLAHVTVSPMFILCASSIITVSKNYDYNLSSYVVNIVVTIIFASDNIFYP